MSTALVEQSMIAVRARRGAPWGESDHCELVSCLSSGMSDNEIAEELERSVSAVRAQAVLMLPAGTPSSAALAMLRDRLDTDRDYDWRAAIVTAATTNGRVYWTRVRENVLVRGWVDAVPMIDLVPRLGVTEDAVIRQLLGWRLVSDVDEIEARIGLIPDGNDAVRRRLAADKRSAKLWCLVMSEEASPPHISLHPTLASADAAKDDTSPPVRRTPKCTGRSPSASSATATQASPSKASSRPTVPSRVSGNDGLPQRQPSSRLSAACSHN